MIRIPINEQGWGLIVQLISNFVGSGVGSKAVGLFALLIGLLLGVNGLNIVASYVGRDFITAISDRDMPAYLWQALFYCGVFAASTVVAVFLRYVEERLGLLWRDWMTRHFVALYLRPPTYYRMNDAVIRTSGTQHIDQRIADDVRAFTTTTLSFTLMLLNGILTVVAFSGILWTISPLLFAVAVLYAALGSWAAVLLGSRLVDLNYTQLDKEATFRSGLMHVRERAESVVLLHCEAPMLIRLLRQFDDLADNLRKVFIVNRNLGFFTTGYNYMAQIIPVLLAAPLFIHGNAEFGVITQSATAFAMLVGAFSLIITQFQSITSFAAVVQRLVNLWYAIELTQTETVSGLKIREDNDCVAYESLTVRSSITGNTLIRDLSLSIPHGTRVLVTGNDEVAKDALLRATVGIEDTGRGCVIRPRLEHILFLPERPYSPPGTLREVLLSDLRENEIPDEEIIETLRSLKIETVLTRAGGLDAEQDWDSILSSNEQQLISFARILLASPRFAFLDFSNTSLDQEKAGQLLKMLSDKNITYLTLGQQGQQLGDEWISNYDAVLDLKSDGAWEWQEVREEKNSPAG